MTNLAVQAAFDVEAYLAWEERQVEKHEFIVGEVFAMAGARRDHVVSGNLYAAFKQRLRGGPCQAYVADLKVRVEAADAFFYPDVVVSCEPRDHAADQFITYPTLIVEVLLEATAAFDPGKKFAAYRTLPSLREYVLVDIETRRVETFQRTPENDWLLHEYLPGCGECRFPAVNVSIPFDEIFENVAPQAGLEGFPRSSNDMENDMLTRDARLIIPEQVVTRQVGDETVLLNLESGTYFGLDPVGSRFLELLQTEGALAPVIARMLEEFDVTEAQLEADLFQLSEEMLASGLLEAA